MSNKNSISHNIDYTFHNYSPEQISSGIVEVVNPKYLHTIFVSTWKGKAIAWYSSLLSLQLPTLPFIIIAKLNESFPFAKKTFLNKQTGPITNLDQISEILFHCIISKWKG